MWHHPAMASFTFDTNCLIDVAEERPSAPHVRAILAAGADGQADLALVASSASERQQGDTFLESIDAFEERRSALGFGSLPLLPSMARWGVSFFGNAVCGWAEGVAREQAIFTILFPASPFSWTDYASSKDVDPNDKSTAAYMRWRNQILDAQALWAHDNAGRDVFVTSDQRLKAIDGHSAFPTMAIKTPAEAVGLL